MQLNYFRGLTDCEPKTTTLEEVVRLMTDDMSVRDLTEKYRYYLSMGDEYSTRRCKSLLPCFAVAVHFSGGKHNKHIVDFTGLTIVDIDHVPPEEMPRVLTIIREAPHTLLCYTTVSGQGIRVIARYSSSPSPKEKSSSTSTSTLTSYKTAFTIVNQHYATLTGYATDEKCKNATRLSCLSHDPHLFFNPEARENAL